jgi:hypothetical protein
LLSLKFISRHQFDAEILEQVGNDNAGPFGNDNAGPFGNDNAGPFGNDNAPPCRTRATGWC